MARRRKRTDERRPSQTETRKYQLRERKERRERQLLLAVLGPVLALTVGVLGYGTYRELIQKPRTPVARVEGETITGSTYATRVKWQRSQLLNNLSSIAQLAISTDPSFITNFANNSRISLPQDVLNQLVDEALIRQEAEERDIDVTDDDVDERIFNDMATLVAPESDSGVEVITGEDITVTDSVTATVAATATVTAIPTDAIGDAYERSVKRSLDQAGVTDSDYRAIVHQIVFRERLGEALGEEVTTTEKQVEVEYMRFSSEETAIRASEALTTGVAWADVVAEYREPEVAEEEEPADEEPADDASADESSADEASDGEEGGAAAEDEAGIGLGVGSTGDITVTGEVVGSESVTDTEDVAAAAGITATEGITPTATPAPTLTPAPTATPNPFATEVGERTWMTRDGIKAEWGLGDAEADAVVALEPGTSSSPILVGGTVFYLVHAFDVEEARELEADELESRKSAALEDWLTRRRLEAQVDRFPLEAVTPPEPDWFVNGFNQIVGVPQPTIDLGAFQVSTTAPEGAEGAEGAEGGAPAEDAPAEDAGAEAEDPDGGSVP